MEEKQKNRLVVIDGNAIVHRAYHALPPLTTKDGGLVNAVYGFSSILLKVLKDLKPTHMAVTFDLAGPTFRHKKFEAYKATRAKADQELYDQIPLVHDVVRAFGIPIFEVQEFEADDVIGTIINKNKSMEMENVIVTGDMDALQLVNDNTKVYALRKGISDIIIFDEKKVKEKYGLMPKQIVDLKALQGDSSDNIPGVRGIGPKGATELLQKFSSLKEVLEAAEDKNSDVAENIRKKLLDGKEDALMSEELARIQTDVPLKFSLQDAALCTTDWQNVADIFSEFEFTSLLKRLPTKEHESTKAQKHKSTKTKIAMLSTKKEIDHLLRKAHEAEIIGMNLLPSGADRITSDIAAAVLCVNGDGFVILFDKCDQEQKNSIIRLLETDTVIGHDLKQLFIMIGAVTGAQLFDVMVASYLLDPGSRTHDAETIILKRLGVQINKQEGLFGADFKQAAQELCEITSLHPEFKKELKEIGLTKLFEDIEMPLIPVLARMEKNGVKVDEKNLSSLSKKITDRIQKVSKQVYKLSGEKFNISSSVQLREILYEKLKLPTLNIKKGKTGLSTAATELEKLRGQHEIIPLLEEYRELTKLQTTYTDALPQLVNKKTGRIHTSFNQTITATGRLSSSDPNLQNIPIRTELGREIRNAFVAEKGNLLVAADYSQIELRIAASISGDKKMIEAFKKGQDIHTATAAYLHDVALDKVTKEMRRGAKTINFGILYGMGAFGMAWRAGIPQWEAQKFIDRYFNTFSGLKKYLEDTIKIAKKHGYVETVFGRRRYIPELKAGNVQMRNAGERMAINHPLQGTAADIIKKAMIAIDARIRNSWPEDVKMILQVHDELVFEITEKKAKQIAPKIKEIMEDVVELSVPVIVDIGIGKNWRSIK